MAAAVAAPAADPTTNGAPRAPLSRREIREQREREQADAKTAKKGSTTKPARSKRSKWIRRGVAIAVVILLIPVAVSYVHYLQRPGSDTLSVRTVEWIRDHGGNGVVNTIERWWYTNNPPPTGGTPSAIKVQDTVTETTEKPGTRRRRRTRRSSGPAAADRAASPPRPPRSSRTRACGSRPGGSSAATRPSTRPTCAPTRCTPRTTPRSMWLDTKLLRANYVVGSEQPGGNGPNPWGSQIPDAERPNAIAAFNSGFKMDSAHGGAYLDGATIEPLRRRVGVARDQEGRQRERRRVGS